jgi:hypothetical protein
MSFVDFHDKAMAMVDEAREAERAGNQERRIESLRAAYRLEKQAANLLDPIADSEPTRSVLFRSASSLAFQAEDYHEACNLAFDGLNGNCPEDLAAELLEVANDAKFRLQLIAQDLRIVENEITLIVRGPGVSIGLAPAKQVTLMLRRIEMLLRWRIEEFLNNKIGTRSDWATGRPKLFEVFMRPLVGEEFAVAFRLGVHEQLLLFSPTPVGEKIVAEFMSDLQSVMGDGSDIENRVVAPKFVAAVLKLNPDGKDVTSIEISSLVSDRLVCVRIPPRKGPSSADPWTRDAKSRTN